MHYVLDKSASRFTVRAFASGMLSVLGHSPTIAIRDFSGESFSTQPPGRRPLYKSSIRADSLEVTDDIKSSDRREMEATMNTEVLESAKYPDHPVRCRRGFRQPVGRRAIPGEHEWNPVAAWQDRKSSRHRAGRRHG